MMALAGALPEGGVLGTRLIEGRGDAFALAAVAASIRFIAGTCITVVAVLGVALAPPLPLLPTI